MDLARLIYDAGVVGAGGAGFPTHRKLLPDAGLLVVNAAECEPLLASDRYLMRHCAEQIVAGIVAVVDEFAIGRVVIGTKRHYVAEIAALRAAISAAGADIEIGAVDSFYPAGDEQVLIYELTGQTVPPGKVPIALGIVVINVTTAYQIHRATLGEPMLRRAVTVNGAVRAPRLVDAPVGTTPADLIAAAGGASCERHAFIKGGPMMGPCFAADAAGSFGYGKADSGLVVLPAEHPLVAFAGKPLEHVLGQTSACIQCRLCTDMCPRYLIGHQMRPHLVMRVAQTRTHVADLADALLCCECGICELYACPMGLSPRRVNVWAKGVLREAGVTAGDPNIYPEQTADHPMRKIPQSRLIERWRLDPYPTELDEVVSIAPSRVLIPTKHGVGRPADPIVAVGDRVSAGQVIATVDQSAIGALVHASIDGRVSAVDATQITIER
ncbi:MAG: 4Fe-4S dicluster domain-containing protein [Actinomycetia bacterium]|nr:4Fe-4S dicluster domain-containing protein [Actinomycetes bacterium]